MSLVPRSRVLLLLDHAIGVLLAHLIGQLLQPPEVLIPRRRAARGIDFAVLVAIPIVMLITVRPRLRVIRRARPKLHPTLALQLLPALQRMSARAHRTQDGA